MASGNVVSFICPVNMCSLYWRQECPSPVRLRRDPPPTQVPSMVWCLKWFGVLTFAFQCVCVLALYLLRMQH